jgi:magnesium chelatase family protein
VACRCTPEQASRYRGKLSGPLLDRIDLLVELPPSDPDWMDAPPGESSAAVRARVQRCRALQLARQGGLNARLSGPDLDAHCPMSDEARALLRKAMVHLNGSARAVHRTLRVARTAADLDGQEMVGARHVAEGMQYRHPPS